MVRVPLPTLTVGKKLLNVSFLKNSSVATKIAESLKYEEYNHKELDVLDIYPGNMLFSSALHNVLQPKRHLILESRPRFSKSVEQYIDELGTHGETKGQTMEYYNLNPYNWQTYLDLTNKETGTLQVAEETRDHIHSKFMLTGYVSEESLLMQWLACMGNQNWIQRFGNVRMLLWVPESSAVKVMALPGSTARNRCSLVMETFSDSRLLATPNTDRFKTKSPFGPLTLEQGNTLIIDEADLTGVPMSLLEINPKNHSLDDVFAWDYVTKSLLILRTKPVGEAIRNVGPGAAEYFHSTLSPELLQKRVKDLTAEDFVVISHSFGLWPFKPDFNLDLVLEDTYS